jgi:hypothetical protein
MKKVIFTLIPIAVGFVFVQSSSAQSPPGLGRQLESVPVVAGRLTASTLPGRLATNDISLEIKNIGELRGISAEEAQASLSRQDRLIRFANDYRAKHAGQFVDFKIDDVSAKSGTLVVEPGSEAAGARQVFGDDSVTVSVRESRATTAERELERLSLAAETGASEEDVYYDAFTDTLSVHVRKGSPDRENRAVRIGEMFKEGRTRKDVPAPTVRLIEQLDAKPIEFFGGKLMTSPSPSTAGTCTSGFGLYKSGLGGYLTMGHCGVGSWTVNGSTSSNVYDSLYGNYLDSEVLNAGGASWLVQTGPSQTQDMAASADQWMYQNTTYCTYSAQTNSQNCGTLSTWPGQTSPYNFNFVIGGVTTRATTTTMLCKGGDSGGPMWRPVPGGESRPAGSVKGSSGTFSPDAQGRVPCAFMKVWDQLQSNGWALL